MSQLLTPERTTVAVVSASIITALALISLARQSKAPKIIPSPRAALPAVLTAAEEKALVYPPDILPGGRDVYTPYGSIRVYEWGPEDGKKVLFVHGITTPCLALGAVAHGLVEKGCRVMLFDLWGRGYSDACGDLDYDERLYSSQILLVLTSSKLSWIGGSSGGFNLIGYSLGGGIAASFTSYFSDMVKSLVLLAPAGLLRPKHISSVNRFLYSSGLIPENFLLWVVRRRLQAGPMYSKTKDGKDDESNKDVDIYTTVEAEASPEKKLGMAPLSKVRPGLTVPQAVAWQVRNHGGFVYSFLSTIRYAPISEQGASWTRLGERKDKTLIITGTTDPIIIPAELKEDATLYVGADKFEYKEINAGHDFPITDSAAVVDTISSFWGL